MKNVIIVIAVSLFSIDGISQIQEPVAETKSDSASIAKTLNDLALFNLSENDKEKVSAAAQKVNQIRKEAIKNYWKSPSFQNEFNKGGLYKDSVLLQVLGKDRFMNYKAQMMEKRDQFESAQRYRWRQQKNDSTSHN